VAVELVHAASLVHDDILDGAVLRRGQSTVVAAEGREVAIATGDLMFSRAFAELARNERADHLRALADAASALARGELVQREDAWQVVTVARYLERCRLKTASLFEASCKLGALAGPGAPAPRASRRGSELGRFGREIGMAFQILDDVLDVQGPPERTGKARGADLMDGTVNLPLILARRRDPELAALDLHSLREPEVAELVCRRIAATGALEQARERALRLVARAKAQLPQRLPPGQREVLELVADGVVERFS
jgi:geranylgeranyl pyrophosphate synthase